MGVANYSPTVWGWYKKDRDWFKKNGGGFGNGEDPDSLYDDDGFDSYGYDEREVDRAGVSEDSYLGKTALINAIDAEWESKPFPISKKNQQSKLKQTTKEETKMSNQWEIESFQRLYDNLSDCAACFEFRVCPDFPENLMIHTPDEESKDYYGNIRISMPLEQAEKFHAALGKQIQEMKENNRK